MTDYPPAPPARVERGRRDGGVLAFGSGARVLAVRGHTNSGITLYLPHSGVLFTGDTIAAGRNGQIIRFRASRPPARF